MHFLAVTNQFDDLISTITTAIPTSDILSIVGLALTAGAGYVLIWFGIRFIKKQVSKGIFRGRF